MTEYQKTKLRLDVEKLFSELELYIMDNELHKNNDIFEKNRLILKSPIDTIVKKAIKNEEGYLEYTEDDFIEMANYIIAKSDLEIKLIKQINQN